MRRWNGWGDDANDFPLTDAARAFLQERIGPAQPPKDALREQILNAVLPSRLQSSALFSTEVVARLDHARGQSLPDLLALRTGRVGPCADAVACPSTHEEAALALAAAKKLGAIVIPYGGGTSVVGHLNVPTDDRPVVNISLEKMNRLMGVDETSLLARFGAGTPGPQIESQLRMHGYLLGHFPQSYELSTLGGWVVTRSSGQQSYRYGRIENLFAAGRLLTPRGELAIGGVPASSAGPDLREALMGSEGRLGLLTEVTARIRRLPERDEFHAIFFPSWEAGIEAVRALVQEDVALSMLRLSNPIETETQLALSGHDKLIVWLQRYLGFRGIGSGQCMLMAGITGSAHEVRRLLRQTLAICRRFQGVSIGKSIGKGWAKNRFRGPYLRNSLWEAGYAADTAESSINWPQATRLMTAIETAAREALASENEKVHVFTHLSHVYRQGCSIYSTFVYRSAGSYEPDMERWKKLKTRVSEAIVSTGGTISHQHGVGVDHAPYLSAEKGALGLDLIRAMARELDPDGMMNPGKLFA